MIVKFMDQANCSDDDSRKTHSLYEGVTHIEFHRDPDEGPVAYLNTHREFEWDSQCVPVRGNVYVMNDEGRTISTFSPSSIP